MWVCEGTKETPCRRQRKVWTPQPGMGCIEGECLVCPLSRTLCYLRLARSKIERGQQGRQIMQDEDG